MADTDATGVSVQNMQEYLNLDANEDADLLKDLIDMAEADIVGNIDSTVSLDIYRGYKLFNQAVKTIVDFTYFNRGNLATQQLAYPASYAYMLNGIRYKIRGDPDANSSA